MDGERDDLGAMFAAISRRIIAAETPLLAAHGLSMWEYIALSHLIRTPGRNQQSLAQAMHYDKTRLIRLLDGLQDRDLVRRMRDPADRRSQLSSITPEGRRVHAAARDRIRVMEGEFLATLDDGQQNALLAALARLADSAGGA